ncbi:MAG: hypothetical protein HN348_12460 [Proteobacteria bacterium]|nr:hypothetical protein [Pseudomonadota bacterium]
MPLIWLALTLTLSTPAKAFEGRVEPFGHLQTRLTVWEQMEEADELLQFPSEDPAAQVVSGFGLTRVRAGLRAYVLKDALEMKVQMRVENGPAILDAYGALHLHDAFSIVVGQMKIPGPGENLETSRELDFITRPLISKYISDFSLSRTTYASSLFYGIHSYMRDLGITLKGDGDLGVGHLRYRAMVGNGLGANRFIGGGTTKEYIITNPGQFFVGGRLEAAEFFQVVTIGSHVNYNRHDNMVFNSGRIVYDLNRLSWSGDLRVVIPNTGLRLGGLYGGGLIDDDYDDDGHTDVQYSGWSTHLIFRLNDPISLSTPASQQKAFWTDHIVEVGARAEQYHYEWNEGGAPIVQTNWTFGLSYSYREYVNVKLNYALRRTDDPSLPDLDDDALLMQMQFAL